jgi:ribosomal protein L37AE/L43A
VIRDVMLVLVSLAGWAAFVHFSPEHVCPWCRGARKRRRGCWRCGGTGKTWRLGARLVHKVKLALLRAWDEREGR